MKAARILLAGVAAVAVMGAGAVVADALLDRPQDATPSRDPVGDALRQTNGANGQSNTQRLNSTPPAPVETPPSGDNAPPRAVQVAPAETLAAAETVEIVEPVEEEEVVTAPPPPDPAAARRQRRPIAVIKAIDKITADSMTFEVEVGGAPVRFNKNLIFTARACEVSAADELTEDAIAYVDVALMPRGAERMNEARQIFRGWMFASSPGVSGLQHPFYDAWVVGCKA